MKVRPIIFSGWGVRAILEGRKTQTRRVIRRQPHPTWTRNYELRPYDEDVLCGSILSPGYLSHCPYGVPGDRLWVRETFALHPTETELGKPIVFYCSRGDTVLPNNKWRPTIYMPRWASRITLEIVKVWVERLWEISLRDIIAEGVLRGHRSDMALADAYTLLWDQLNARRGFGWLVNPWVWVIEFKVLDLKRTDIPRNP